MSTNLLSQISHDIAEAAAAAAPALVAIDTGRRRACGILWRGDVIVASRQTLPEADGFSITLHGGERREARFAGADPGTNVALLRLETPAPFNPPAMAADPLPGHLAILLGAGEAGRHGARLAGIAATGPAWHSMAGGLVERRLWIDRTLRPGEEGAPVLDPAGALHGMACAGPRGRALIIPHETIARVLEPLLREGRVARPWLGLGLQAVELPEALREAAGQAGGLMVVSLDPAGPAQAAGILPGDILLRAEGTELESVRGLARWLTAERLGQPVKLGLLRGGTAQEITLTPAARPRG